MQGVTHILGGAAAGMLCASALGLQGVTFVGAVSVAIVGSLFPDIDSKTSKLGSKVKPLSGLIGKIFKHRTFFHSPILYFALYFGMQTLWPEGRIATDCFTAGAISHLFLDMLNVKGIPLFYPFGRMYHLATIKTGKAGEMALRSLLAVTVCIGIIWRMTHGNLFFI